MGAFQVKIAYLTPQRRTRHFFHRLVIAETKESALAEARRQLAKSTRNTRIVHQAATLRPDSNEAEAAVLSGWSLRDGWWTRPLRSGDNLAAVAGHGYVTSRSVNVRNTADCVAIDRSAAYQQIIRLDQAAV